MIGGFKDGLNLLSKTTFRKAKNAWNVYQSYQSSRKMSSPSMKGLPIAVSIEPTTSCNLRCPECPSGLRSFTRPTGMLDTTLFKSIIDQLSPSLSYLTFYFQGEPYLNPSFLDMVKYASQRGIYTATSTNAHYLTEEKAYSTVQSGLDRLIVSIDGTTQETYESYRIGGDLKKVLNGAQNVLQVRKKLRAHTPHVVFQFLVVGPNEHQIPEIHSLAEKVGVDQLVLKSAQVYDYKNGSPFIPREEKYSRYVKEANGNYKIKNSLDNSCWKMWHSCVITWDGKVVPCCFDKDGTYVMGDLTKNSFEEIWFGKTYDEFRRTLFNSRSEIEMCRNCTEGAQVWV